MATEDALDVATVHTLAWQWAYKGIVEQNFLDALDIEKRTLGWKREIEDNVPANIRIVVEYDEQVIGFASGLENRKQIQMPQCDAELWAIYVHLGTY